jgi:hypothetical protein
MNVTACLLVVLVLVPVATHPASIADAQAPAHERRHGARDRGNVAPSRDTTSVIGAGYVGQDRLPTHRRIHVPPVKLEKPAPAGAKSTASVDGTQIRATTHADINGTKIRPPTPSLNGTSIGARR